MFGKRSNTTSILSNVSHCRLLQRIDTRATPPWPRPHGATRRTARRLLLHRTHFMFFQFGHATQSLVDYLRCGRNAHIREQLLIAGFLLKFGSPYWQHVLDAVGKIKKRKDPVVN